MTRPDYTEIDRLIKGEIGRGNCSHKGILFALRDRLEEYCYDNVGRYRGTATQLLSNRLQAMKRWQQIVPMGEAGWALVGEQDNGLHTPR